MYSVYFYEANVLCLIAGKYTRMLRNCPSGFNFRLLS